MINRKTIASILAAATCVGAAISTTPAAAIPSTGNNGNGGNPAQSIFGLFGDCVVEDANYQYYEDPNCVTHNTFKPVAGSNTDPYTAAPAVGMYWDHGHLPAGAAFPTSEMTFTYGFEYMPGVYISCNSRLTPSGDYKSTCYFNAQSNSHKQP